MLLTQHGPRCLQTPTFSAPGFACIIWHQFHVVVCTVFLFMGSVSHAATFAMLVSSIFLHVLSSILWISWMFSGAPERSHAGAQGLSPVLHLSRLRYTWNGMQALLLSN